MITCQQTYKQLLNESVPYIPLIDKGGNILKKEEYIPVVGRTYNGLITLLMKKKTRQTYSPSLLGYL